MSYVYASVMAAAAAAAASLWRHERLHQPLHLLHAPPADGGAGDLLREARHDAHKQSPGPPARHHAAARGEEGRRLRRRARARHARVVRLHVRLDAVERHADHDGRPARRAANRQVPHVVGQEGAERVQPAAGRAGAQQCQWPLPCTLGCCLPCDTIRSSHLVVQVFICTCTQCSCDGCYNLCVIWHVVW